MSLRQLKFKPKIQSNFTKPKNGLACDADDNKPEENHENEVQDVYNSESSTDPPSDVSDGTTFVDTSILQNTLLENHDCTKLERPLIESTILVENRMEAKCHDVIIGKPDVQHTQCAMTIRNYLQNKINNKKLFSGLVTSKEIPLKTCEETVLENDICAKKPASNCLLHDTDMKKQAIEIIPQEACQDENANQKHDFPCEMKEDHKTLIDKSATLETIGPKVKHNDVNPDSDSDNLKKNISDVKKMNKAKKKELIEKITLQFNEKNIQRNDKLLGPEGNVSPRQNKNIVLENSEKATHVNINTNSNQPSIADVIRKRPNAVFGSKSIRCHRAMPVKPKLTKRSKRPFATSTFGKMSCEAKQQFQKKFGNEAPDSSKLTMWDLIFYNPSTNPMPKPDERTPEKIESSSKKDMTTEDKNSTQINENVEKKDVSDENNKNRNEPKNEDPVPVPQLKLSGEGKVIVAKESLVVEQSVGEISTNVEYIKEGARRKRKRKRDCKRYGWTHDETIMFYKALNSIGSDFELMQSIFPERSRYNLKSKFKKEEKVHGGLIDKVMKEPSEFNLNQVIDELENCDDLTTDQIKNIVERHKEKTGSTKKCTKKKKYCENITVKNNIKRKYIKKNTDVSSQNEHVYSLRKNEVDNDEVGFVNTSIPSSFPCDTSKKIVISTNIEYDNVKYTQYITYNSNNLENPVEVNATISHEGEQTKETPIVEESVASSSP